MFHNMTKHYILPPHPNLLTHTSLMNNLSPPKYEGLKPYTKAMKQETHLPDTLSKLNNTEHLTLKVSQSTSDIKTPQSPQHV